MRSNPGSENVNEEEKTVKRRGVIILAMTLLFIFSSFLVETFYESCASEFFSAVFCTVLLLLAYLLLGRKLRESMRKSCIFVILVILWILFLIQFWVTAILECMRGY